MESLINKRKFVEERKDEQPIKKIMIGPIEEMKKFLETIINPLINANIYIDTDDQKKAQEKLIKMFQEDTRKKYDDNFLFILRKSSSYPESIIIIHYSMLQDPNYQNDGEFVFDSAINLDKVNVKKDDKGYYLEKFSEKMKMRFYNGYSFLNYLQNQFHEDLKETFLIKKNKKINRYITQFDPFEKEIMINLKKNEIWNRNNFNKEIPDFREKIQFFLKSTKQENNLFAKLRDKEIIKQIIKNYAEDLYFESVDKLLEQTRSLLKETNLGKRIIYEPEMRRDEARKIIETKEVIVLRELTSIKRKGFIIDQLTPKGIMSRVVLVVETKMKSISSKNTFLFRVEMEKDPKEKENIDLNYLNPREFVEYVYSRRNFLPCLKCNEFGHEFIHVSKDLHCEYLNELWCDACAKEYIFSKIVEGDFLFRCCGCGELIPLENVERFLKTKQYPNNQIIMEKLKIEIQKNELKKNGHQILYCPTIDCNGIFALKNVNLSFIDCLSCRKRMCFYCKEEYHENDFICAQKKEFLNNK